MLTAIKAWLISGALNFVLGFVAGWIFLKRPQWVEAFVAWVKGKLGITA